MPNAARPSAWWSPAIALSNMRDSTAPVHIPSNFSHLRFFTFEETVSFTYFGDYVQHCGCPLTTSPFKGRWVTGMYDSKTCSGKSNVTKIGKFADIVYGQTRKTISSKVKVIFFFLFFNFRDVDGRRHLWSLRSLGLPRLEMSGDSRMVCSK